MVEYSCCISAAAVCVARMQSAPARGSPCMRGMTPTRANTGPLCMAGTRELSTLYMGSRSLPSVISVMSVFWVYIYQQQQLLRLPEAHSWAAPCQGRRYSTSWQAVRPVHHRPSTPPPQLGRARRRVGSVLRPTSFLGGSIHRSLGSTKRYRQFPDTLCLLYRWCSIQILFSSWSQVSFVSS